MIDVIPAILTASPEELAERLRAAESFAGFVHIDLMDGTMTTQESVSVEQLEEAAPDVPFEVHVMSRTPLALLDMLLAINPFRVLVHAEAAEELDAALTAIALAEIEAGLVLDAATRDFAWEPYRTRLQQLTFLAVPAGAQGGVPAWELIRAASRLHRDTDMPLEIDGGVRRESLPHLLRVCTPDRLTVGSALWTADDPAVAYHALVDELAQSGYTEPLR